jgi:hypothetical protein
MMMMTLAAACYVACKCKNQETPQKMPFFYMQAMFRLCHNTIMASGG